MNDVSRIYKIENAELLSESNKLHKHFTNRLADFTAFNANMNAAFATAWEEATAEAAKIPTDETLLDQLQGYTDKVKKQVDNCLSAANSVRYYVKEAFPKNRQMLQEFDFSALNTFRHSSIKLYLWMLVLHNRTVKYKPELLAAAMPEASIDALPGKAQNLLDADVAQETFKRERTAFTSKRYAAHNNVWRILSRVSRAAAIVFGQDEEQRQLFYLPR